MTAACDLLEGAPAEYLTPVERPTLAEAQAWCRNLATTHYENFHVATFFLPRRCGRTLRASMRTAGCRMIWAMRSPIPWSRLRLLDTWGAMLDECYDAPERSMHPVFVALQETIRECELPRATVSRICCCLSDGPGEDEV